MFEKVVSSIEADRAIDASRQLEGHPGVVTANTLLGVTQLPCDQVRLSYQDLSATHRTLAALLADAPDLAVTAGKRVIDFTIALGSEDLGAWLGPQHGDLHPLNVMVDSRGRSVLVDLVDFVPSGRPFADVARFTLFAVLHADLADTDLLWLASALETNLADTQAEHPSTVLLSYGAQCAEGVGHSAEFLWHLGAERRRAQRRRSLVAPALARLDTIDWHAAALKHPGPRDCSGSWVTGSGAGVPQNPCLPPVCSDVLKGISGVEESG